MIKQKSLDQLREFTELGTDWCWELDEGLFFTYSRCFTSFGAASALENLVGASVLDVADPSASPRPWEAVFAGRRAFSEQRFPLKTPDGEIRWMSLNARPQQSASGEFLGYRGVGRDITAVAAIERQAKLHEASYDQLLTAFEAATDSIALWGADERLVLCNSIYRRQSGRVADLLQPGLKFEDYLRAGIATQEVTIGEMNAAQWIAERLKSFRNGGAMEALRAGRWLLIDQHRTPEGGALITCSDITELKNREIALIAAQKKAEEANLAKSFFLAHMSHELRTPLNAILGYSEIVKEQLFGPDLPRYAEYAGLIHQSGEYLLSLINALLDLTRIEAGHYKLEEAVFPLEEALAATLNATRPMADKRGVALTLRADVEGPLAAERRGLIQILINLLTNAIKFSPVGSEVRLHAALTEESELLLSIDDQGCGMTEDEIAHAFEPFRRGDAEITRESEGVGLGLAISQRLAQLHGGRLDIQSAPKNGTRITLFLPKDRCEGLRPVEALGHPPARRDA